MTVLLVVPAHSYRARAFMDGAARCGQDVVVVSDASSSIAALLGDRHVRVDLDDPAAAAAAAWGAARQHGVAGVVGVDETAVIAAAALAEHLGVRHHPVAAVRMTRDKRWLRRRLSDAGMIQPLWAETDVATVERAALAEAERLGSLVGFPCVVKPVDLSGSRGVIRADGVAALTAALLRVARLLRRPDVCAAPSAPIVVEEFVGGDEVSVEALVEDGDTEIIAVFDKPDPLEGPFFEETIYVTPSRHPDDVRRAVEQTTAIAADALGLCEGPIHAELRVGSGGPVVIEVAARSIGGMCSSTLRAADGTTLEEVIIRRACGLPSRVAALHDRPDATGVMMLPTTVAGIFREVRGQDAARRHDGIEGLDILTRPGDRLEPLPEGGRYLGFVFARAASAELVEAALRRARASLHTVVDPPPASAVASPSYDVETSCGVGED